MSLSRRTFLRGAGVTLALPWLESLPRWSTRADAPVRLAVIFAGNGFHSKEYWAKGQGAAMELGKVLQPFEPLKEKLLFIRGLFNAEALKAGIHSAQTGNLLSGAPLAGGGQVRSGTSFDQVVAQKIGDQTKLPSLVLGCEESISCLHDKYSMIYSSHISWSSPTTAVPLELYPAQAFDRMFKEGVDRGAKSVLDSVLEETRGLLGQVGQNDKHKLDEYLTSVREVEQRIERAGKEGRREGWRPTLEKPNIKRPPDGMPQDIAEHYRLMCDLLVLAFQTDTTRVATLKLCNDHSSLRFPNLGVDYIIHHLLSHTDSADWLKVNQFTAQQVAYIASKLDQIQEGERTLLDNSMIVFLSSMLHGNHDAKQLPITVLGRAGGQLASGRVLDYLDKPNRKACSLYLSLMAKMGVKLDQFGDSNQPLAEL